MSDENAILVGKLLELGLDNKNATDFAKNMDRAKEYVTLCEKHSAVTMDLRKKKMTHNLFVKLKYAQHREVAMTWLTKERVKTTSQVTAMVTYLSKLNQDDDINESLLAEACGAGKDITDEMIRAAVHRALEVHMEKILSERYKFNSGQLIGTLTKQDPELKWAEGSSVKSEVEAQISQILGERKVEDDIKTPVPTTSTPSPVSTVNTNASSPIHDPNQVDDYRTLGEGITRSRIDELPTQTGKSVYICGWAHRVRHQSKMSFVVIRDGTGYVQVVFGWRIPPFHRETSLAIVGVLHEEPKAKGDNSFQIPFEIHVTKWAIIGASDGDIENIVTGESAPDVLFDQRHLVLRGSGAASLMMVRASLLRAFREFFYQRRILEVTPPTMVQTQCEGGSTLFELGFYDEKAYLTQSSQLYLETCLPGMGDVYCILSSYRAEKSKTRRHLSEYTHVEAELGNILFTDLLDFLEDMMVKVMEGVFRDAGHLIAHHNPAALKSPGADPKDPNSWTIMPVKPFARLRYSEAIQLLAEHKILNPETGSLFVYGDDIPDKIERELVERIGKPILLTHFPATMKAFYMSRVHDDNTLTESVDVLMPGVGETVGGSMRIWNYEELMKAYHTNELDPSPYFWYTDQRKFGSVPHGGFGLGLERMLMWLLQLDHVKEACLYPRLMGRCKP